MHAVGKLFPRGDRAPAIVPVAERDLRRMLAAEPLLQRLAPGRTERVASGFYTSQALELRGHESGPQRRAAQCGWGGWARATRFLPFADAATPELPLARLLRLSLFQVSVGMAMVLLTARSTG
jgi:hypothetical protein